MTCFLAPLASLFILANRGCKSPFQEATGLKTCLEINSNFPLIKKRFGSHHNMSDKTPEKGEEERKLATHLSMKGCVEFFSCFCSGLG